MLRSLLVILAMGSVSLCGCGTFSDAMCGPVGPGFDYVFYRGVRFDVLAIKEGGPKTLMAADIPLSAAVDTLLVPYLAYQELTDPRPKIMHKGSKEEAKADERKADPIPQVIPKD